MTWLSMALKFGPWLAIALLLGVLLWQRGNLIDAKADRDKAEQRAADLTDANRSLAAQIGQMEQARKDNDAIWLTFAGKVDANNSREVHTRETITKEIRNDPETRAWADTPVPGGVREALRRPDPLGSPAP